MKQSLNQEINELGFIGLTNFFDSLQIDRVQEAIFAVYLDQYNKLDNYPEFKTSGSIFEDMNFIVSTLEENDKEALYQVQKLLPQSAQIHSFFTDQQIKLFADLLGVKETSVLVNGPGLFINKPGSVRLLYKYHNEAHYYPKRRNFLNLWLPIFHNKTKDNGAMRLKLKSHLMEDIGFNEYTGYDKISENKKNHFVQYEVPEVFHANYQEFVCEYNLGDLVIFKRNLLHTSNANITEKPSYALVYRIWENSMDLTLSGDFAIRPYSGSDGAPNIKLSK